MWPWGFRLPFFFLFGYCRIGHSGNDEFFVLGEFMTCEQRRYASGGINHVKERLFLSLLPARQHAGKFCNEFELGILD